GREAVHPMHPLAVHQFTPSLKFLVPNERLDDGARSRPVLHDVAAGQVREAGVPTGARLPRFQGRNPPAQRIAAGVVPPTALVAADLELRGFAALSRILARR